MVNLETSLTISDVEQRQSCAVGGHHCSSSCLARWEQQGVSRTLDTAGEVLYIFEKL